LFDITIFVDVSLFTRNANPLNRYRKFWAERLGAAHFLPMSRDKACRKPMVVMSVRIEKTVRVQQAHEPLYLGIC
jgi:hypothetical protein